MMSMRSCSKPLVGDERLSRIITKSVKEVDGVRKPGERSHFSRSIDWLKQVG